MVQQEDEEPAGAPEWMVTYSDMISLLVTFFILLMTFSTMASDNLFPMRGSLMGLGGIMPVSGRTPIEPPKDDLMAATEVQHGGDTPHSRPKDTLLESTTESGQRATEEHIEFDLRDVNDGIVLHFDADSSFAPGSDVVNAKLHKALAGLARVLENYPFLVVIEGFTDTAFKPSPSFQTAEAMACARARAAAQVMLQNSRLSPKLVQVAGLGAQRALNDNATASQRAANRRVEVHILSLSRSRAAALQEGGRSRVR